MPRAKAINLMIDISDIYAPKNHLFGIEGAVCYGIDIRDGKNRNKERKELDRVFGRSTAQAAWELRKMSGLRKRILIYMATILIPEPDYPYQIRPSSFYYFYIEKKIIKAAIKYFLKEAILTKWCSEKGRRGYTGLAICEYTQKAVRNHLQRIKKQHDKKRKQNASTLGVA